MNRFELAVDGYCDVGKFKSTFVNAIEYGDNDYLEEDYTEFEEKARNMATKMNGKTISEIVDIIRDYGLDFDKVLIDKGGLSFDSFTQSFSNNVFLISFNFDFPKLDIICYPS